MNDQGLINLQWAHALVDGLAAAGVRRVVISPGSRSTPLVLACDRHPAINTQVVLDERSAAFHALGQAKADGRPSAVLATSGSAPAHWYPALLEAGQARIPLLLLSADRPAELQGWGANQTLDQQKLFGVHVRAFHQAGLPESTPSALRQIRQFGIRAVEQSLWPNPGPVHLNLPFREPLVPTAPEAQWPVTQGPAFALQLPPAGVDPEPVATLAGELRHRPGLIICGPTPGGPAQEVEAFAHAVTGLAGRLRVPLLADPLSGLRFGPWNHDLLLTHYDSWLCRHPPASLPAVDWVLRCGAPPISKPLQHYLAHSGARQILLSPLGDWPDPSHRATTLIRSDPTAWCRALARAAAPAGDDRALGTWLKLEQAASAPLAVAGAADPPFEGWLIPELIATLPSGSVLFCGNSLPIRLLDSYSGAGAKTLRILGNRGTSGIDGNLATLAGIADSVTGPVAGLLGDLTLLHDLTSLGSLRGRHLVLIVLNNGGGGIFEHLPQAELDAFERYWLTPQDLDLGQAAHLFGLRHRRIDHQRAFRPALEQALAEPATHLLEVVLDRAHSLQRRCILGQDPRAG